MALSQSVVSELLDAFRAGEGVDLIRDAVTMVLQELIEVEATEQIGAGRYERSETRTTDRNGSRPRLLTTQAGDIELRISKLRTGSFFPSAILVSSPRSTPATDPEDHPRTPPRQWAQPTTEPCVRLRPPRTRSCPSRHGSWFK